MFDVYFRKAALLAAQGHAREGAENGQEAMGLLVGDFYTFEGKPWVMVEDYVTAPNTASATLVSFSKDAFGELSSKLFQSAVNVDRIVVGWFHTHPGFGCFLSPTDINTQQKYFDHPLAIAVVADPRKAEGKSMKKRAYRLTGEGGNYRELSYATV